MKRFGYFITVLFLVLPASVNASDMTIQMLNKDIGSKKRNIYSPALIQIELGDTVKWVATDRGHNVEFVRGAVPEGVKPFRSALGKDVSYTFSTPGAYVYKCTPHYGQGMVVSSSLVTCPKTCPRLRRRSFRARPTNGSRRF